MKLFTGLGVAMVTPFDDKKNIDFGSLRNLVDYVIDGGVDFLTILGTTGEPATMSAAERAEVVEVICKQNNGRKPLLTGVGGNSTMEVVRELKEASWLKHCDGVLSVVPYYNKPAQNGLYEHFKLIGENSPLPVFLYNVPGRTGVNMTAATTARLSKDCPNIAGIKEASGNFEQATDILNLKRADFTVLSGDDGIVLPLMSIGFEGVISVIANAFPREYSLLVNSVKSGGYAAAKSVHLRYADLCKALFAEGNPAGIKAALHAKGVIRYNELRLPLTPVSDVLYKQIQDLCR